MSNSSSSLDFMLPVKRTTAGAALGFVDSELTKKQCANFASTAATSSAASSTVNMAGGSFSNGGNVVGNGKAPIGGAQVQEIDEDLHSRQLAVYGRETMRRLFASNILISGMQGLGAEIGRDDVFLNIDIYVSLTM